MIWAMPARPIISQMPDAGLSLVLHMSEMVVIASRTFSFGPWQNSPKTLLELFDMTHVSATLHELSACEQEH